MRVDAFDFELPPHAIAARPANPRDSARLLEVEGDDKIDRAIGDIPLLLRPGDAIVFNDTRVVPARLIGRRDTVNVETLLHREIAPGRWLAFAKPGKRLKTGHSIVFGGELTAEVAGKTDDGLVELCFNRNGPALSAALAAVGHVPLPPYIRRPDDAQDRADYQTVYARHDGAVAAPTAGLHFTPSLLEAISGQGVRSVHVTLHVGAGTFLPVKADDTADHKMHSEWGEVDATAAGALNGVRAAGGRIVAVGTTAARLIETAADKDGMVRPFAGDTALFITPGYRFKAVDVLMTNFHLPKSTLFMLVSAFAGLARMKAAYRHAIDRNYRFYSYGDACWLHRAEAP